MPPILAKLRGIFSPTPAQTSPATAVQLPNHLVNLLDNASVSYANNGYWISTAWINTSNQTAATTVVTTAASTSNIITTGSTYYYYWQQHTPADFANQEQLANQDYWAAHQAQFNQNQYQQQLAQMNQAQGLNQYGSGQLQQDLLTPAQQNNPEHAALVERYRADQAERQAAENATVAIARGRAKRLLVSHLTPAQRDTFDKKGYFDINKGAYFYRVFLGRSANIVRYMQPLNGRPVPDIGLCCHPGSYVPDEDTVLAQKFMIECDEPNFLKLANRHALESSYVRHYLAQAA